MPIPIIGFALVGPRKIVQIITQAAAFADYISLNPKYKSVSRSRKKAASTAVPCSRLVIIAKDRTHRAYSK